MDTPKLQQSPKYPTVSTNGWVTGIDGKEISLSCPEHYEKKILSVWKKKMQKKACKSAS